MYPIRAYTQGLDDNLMCVTASLINEHPAYMTWKYIQSLDLLWFFSVTMTEAITSETSHWPGRSHVGGQMVNQHPPYGPHVENLMFY